MSVEVGFEGPRADIVLDRPEVLNAMNWDVFEGLARAADEIALRDDVRVCVVSGTGRSFSSGIDVGMFGTGQAIGRDAVRIAQSGFRRVAALPMPTIAVVRGHALGAGMQLALVCDLRVVAADAQMGILEASYGLVPDLGGTQRLPRLAAPGVAKRMIWLAELIDGAEAGRRGIAESVVAEAELEAEVGALASKIAAAPASAVQAVKRLVEISGHVTLDQGMDQEAAAQMSQFSSDDFAAAMSGLARRRRKPD